MSDVAIWIYGDDGIDEREAVRMCLFRLNKSGHRFEKRTATWGWSKGPELAYRLASEPTTANRRAA
jgi:hypothetical protein